MKTLPSANVVIVGGGWSGLLLAAADNDHVGGGQGFHS